MSIGRVPPQLEWESRMHGASSQVVPSGTPYSSYSSSLHPWIKLASKSIVGFSCLSWFFLSVWPWVWNGHVARMPDEWTPKISLFSWLQQPRPQGGPRKRWRDTICQDLRGMGVTEDAWYREATSSRTGWRTLYRALFVEEATRDDYHRMAAAEQPTWQVQCPQCKRCFRRGDRKRHKCLAEQQKPIPEQRGAMLCSTCSKCFHSQGAFAVHHCRPNPH